MTEASDPEDQRETFAERLREVLLGPKDLEEATVTRGLVLLSVGVYAAYSLQARGALTGALVLAVFGCSAFLPVLNAFSTELFPTEYRADAFAWSNNLLGRIGYVLSPPLVGYLADAHGWGPVVRATAVFPLLALGLILALLPETGGRELEETAGM